MKRILNCIPSGGTETDWTFQKALVLGLPNTKALKSIDLRETWWPIQEQGETGACVGYATSGGLLKWHFVKSGLISKEQELSARFIWMANKETDELIKFPTTFIEKAGTQTKLALQIAQKYGCVLDELLPMHGPLSDLDTATFYSIAAKLRIKSYHSLGIDLNHWRQWLSNNGPILARVEVDSAWLEVASHGELREYRDSFGHNQAGHCVCIVGYTSKHFIIRNSWGTDWGDKGYAYASYRYVQNAFSDLYGAIV